MSDIKFQKKSLGFTLIELLIGIAILGIIIAISLPSFSSFLVKTRVDNEISELHRLVSNARNAAINSGKNVTLCPLSSVNKCGTNWQDELSVFANSENTSANNSVFDDKTENIINIVGGNAFNTHFGKLPEYRGHYSHIHPILNSEKSITTTLHFMDSKVDYGDIILETITEIEGNDTSWSLWHKAVKEAVLLNEKILKK